MSPTTVALVVAAVLVSLGIGIAIGRGSRPKPAVVEAPAEVPPLGFTPQLRQTVDLLRSAAMLIDPSDTVVHATSQARTTHLVRNNRIADPQLLDLVRRVRTSQEPIATRITGHPDEGQKLRDLAVRATPLDGGLILMIAEDRSAQTRTDEVKRDFVANVSHELKTPVGALTVLAEAVEQAADDPEAVQHFASRMQREAERLSELVGQIIELSRLQSEDPLMAAELVEVDDIVDAACDRGRPLAAARDVTLTEAGLRGMRVVGDQDQLTGALSNLIQNAINYSDRGARVAISTRSVREADEEYVEISVADNGLGIAKEELERIFERFYRVDYARSRESGGTGLGLSIVKHVMMAHGGTVNVWSKVGQGSTFTLRLPRYVELEAIEVDPLIEKEYLA